MRLAYRIATMKPMFTPGMSYAEMSPEECHGRMVADRRAVSECPKIILDDVEEYFRNCDRREWQVQRDVPNFAPPFRVWFSEWSYPGDGNGYSELGVLTIALEATADRLSTLCSRAERSIADRVRERVSEVRWILVSSIWVSSPKKPTCSSPVWTGYLPYVLVSEKGQVVEGLLSGPGVYETNNANATDALVIVGLGASFMHCKNVKMVEREEPRKESWHRQEKCPVFRFGRLDINPMKEVLRTEGQSESTGLKKALHICRGHFAHYSEERPLFGKYAGDFFIPDHVRGSLARGVVGKDCNVKL